MKNRLIFYFLIFILQFFNIINSHAVDDFNFKVTEIEISESGNVYKGINKGTVSSNNGIIINADEFEYRKNTNELKATGNVEVIDKSSNDQIFANSIIYFKNKEIIYSEGNSKALVNDIVVNADEFEYRKNTNELKATGNVEVIDKSSNDQIFANSIIYFKNKEIIYSEGNSKALVNDIVVNADEFEYRKNTNELKATGNVEVIDKSSNDQIFSNSIIYLKNKEIIYSEGNSKALVNDIVVKGDIFEFDKNKDKFIFKNNVRIDDTLNNNTIFSNYIIYEKNDESFFSKGPTEAIINKKYNFNSSDVFYLNNELKIYSNEESEIKDKFNHYSLSKFNYDILKKELIGEKILILTDYKLPKSDKYFFDSGFFNLEENQFIAQNVKSLLHPTLFIVVMPFLLFEEIPFILGLFSVPPNKVG